MLKNFRIPFVLFISSVLIAACNAEPSPRQQSYATPLSNPDMNEHTFSLREDVTPAQNFIMSQILEAAANIDGVHRASAYSQSNFEVTIGIEGDNDERLHREVYDEVKRIAPNYSINVISYDSFKVKTQGMNKIPLYYPTDVNLKQEIQKRLK